MLTIFKNFFSKKRDEETLDLYRILTESDFKGNYEDTFTVEMMYCILIIDLIVNAENPTELKPMDMYNLAKEVLRIFETEQKECSYYSVRNWTEALLDYMEENKLTYDDIHRADTYSLRKNVSEYLKQGDE